MPKITDTYALAYKACRDYFVRTKAMPTVAAIVAETGRKSPATVAKAVKDWKAELADNYTAAPPHIDGIPEALQGTFAQLWQYALKSAHETLIETNTESERNNKRLITEQAKKLKKLDEEKARISINNDCLISELIESEGKNATLLEENISLKNELAQALEVLEEQKEGYARLERQYESQNDWYLRQLAQEKELMEKKYNIATKITDA